MEEIASFEERLTSLKQKGEDLVASCTDQVQAKISQQVQTHQQGTRDSYSAICSTAQRVRLPPKMFLIFLIRKRYKIVTVKRLLTLLNSSTRVLTESCRNTLTIRTLFSSVKPGSPLYKRSFTLIIKDHLVCRKH